MRFKPFYVLLVVVLFNIVLPITACSKKDLKSNTPSSQGGQDSGGGEILKSTEEEVLDAIQEALYFFENSGFSRNSKLSFFESLEEIIVSDKTVSEDPNKQRTQKIIEEILVQTERSTLHKQIFGQSKVSYDMKDCPGVADHKDAAVSEHKIGATMCFNIKELMNFAPSNLHKELIALIAHEFGHLLGYRETDAQLIQDLVKSSWKDFESLAEQVLLENAWKSYVGVMNALNKAKLELLNDQDTRKRLVERKQKHLLSSTYDFGKTIDPVVNLLNSLVENTKTIEQIFYLKINDRKKIGQFANEFEGISKSFARHYNVRISSTSVFDKVINDRLAATDKAFCDLAAIFEEYILSLNDKIADKIYDKNESGDTSVFVRLTTFYNKEIVMSCENVKNFKMKSLCEVSPDEDPSATCIPAELDQYVPVQGMYWAPNEDIKRRSADEPIGYRLVPRSKEMSPETENLKAEEEEKAPIPIGARFKLPPPEDVRNYNKDTEEE